MGPRPRRARSVHCADHPQRAEAVRGVQCMIRKTGCRFSETIMHNKKFQLEATPAPTPRCTKPPTQSETCTRGAVALLIIAFQDTHYANSKKLVGCRPRGLGRA